MMSTMMCGAENRQRDQHQGGNQPAAPPSILLLRRQFEAFDAPFEPPNRIAIAIRFGGTN
jgi:hypothetical protein